MNLRLPIYAGLLLTLGCSRDEARTYRLPKEAAPAPMHGTMPAPGPMTGSPDLPPPPSEGGLNWTLPKGWTQEKGSGMRFATLKAPNADKVDISVVVLAGQAGGELANVNRWRGQIALPAIDEAALASARRTLKTKAGALAVFDFTSEDKKSRMVAGLLAAPDGRTWFVKMVGETASVARVQPDFQRLMESLRLD